ncbi:hypothetical protein [Microseira wollei]|nr:hypothetical protein [Microseira wollei]
MPCPYRVVNRIENRCKPEIAARSPVSISNLVPRNQRSQPSTFVSMPNL